MAYRTLATLQHSESTDTDTLEAAIDLSRRLMAHLTVVIAGVNVVDPGLYYAGMNTVLISNALHDAGQAAKDMSEALKRRMKAEDVSWDDAPAVSPSGGIGQTLVRHARFADLTVLPQPYKAGRSLADVAALESALLDSGVPVLVLPAGMQKMEMPRRVLLPWDQGAPAMAAARGALPFLIEAEEVVICIIDPPSHDSERSDPGGALATFLHRHGATVRISVLPSSGQRISDVILSEARSQGADMVVMGGYGHSRTRQYILGGTTRRMLEHSPLPLLMAH